MSTLLTNINKDGVILLSGGMDSVTLLHHLKNEYPEANIHALNIYYGQRHKLEIKYAKAHCKKLNVPFNEIKLNFIGDMTRKVSSMIDDSDIEVPNQDYNPDETPSTYVPFRNAIFAVIAASYCETNDLHNIYYAGHMGDSGANYWDCTTDFVRKINALLSMRNLLLVAPFIDIKKSDIAKIAKQYKKLDLSKTWSCYNGGDIHCGTCSTCRERILAMKEAGHVDKTEYIENPYQVK